MQYPNMYGGLQLPQPKRSNRAVFIILGVALLLFGLVVAGGIFGFRAVQQTASTARPIGDRFLDAVAAHRYKEASAMCSTSTGADFSPQNLSDVESLLEKRHGRMQSHGPAQWFVQNNNGQTTVRLTYNAQFANGAIPMVVTVLQTANGYRVVGWNYQIP
jgi:hypothetical protein